MISLQQDDNDDVIEVGDRIRSLSSGDEATVISFAEFERLHYKDHNFVVECYPQHIYYVYDTGDIAFNPIDCVTFVSKGQSIWEKLEMMLDVI